MSFEFVVGCRVLGWQCPHFLRVSEIEIEDKRCNEKGADQAIKRHQIAYPNEQDCRGENDCPIADESLATDSNGSEQRRHAQDQQDVRDIGANNIADGDARRASQRSLNARHEFRRRRPKADQCQPDEQGRHTKKRCRPCSAAHQQLAADDEQHKSARKKQVVFQVAPSHRVRRKWRGASDCAMGAVPCSGPTISALGSKAALWSAGDLRPQHLQQRSRATLSHQTCRFSLPLARETRRRKLFMLDVHSLNAGAGSSRQNTASMRFRARR